VGRSEEKTFHHRDTESTEKRDWMGRPVRGDAILCIAGLCAVGAAALANVTLATNDYTAVLIVGTGMGIVSVGASVLGWRGQGRTSRLAAVVIGVVGGLAAVECLLRLIG
jgi:uncharacterized membrane protein